VVVKAFNVNTHPRSPTAAAVGVSALVLMVVLSRTRIASVASLVALAIPTPLSLGASELVRVEDSGKIPSGIPTPHIPHLSLLSSLDLIAGAATYGGFAAVVGLLSWLLIASGLILIAAELNVVLDRRLWPRSLTGDRFETDRQALRDSARAAHSIPVSTSRSASESATAPERARSRRRALRGRCLTTVPAASPG
jgi:hypothetical protein